MPALDWSAFESLPGDKSRNFENLCRGLVSFHYGRFGHFKALANQPGVEFHLKLTESCALGDTTRWFGWQCKFFTRKQNGDLSASSRKQIESSLHTTEKCLPEITDWVLWVPYTLSKKDQQWFFDLATDMKLHLWAGEEVENYLSGDGLLLRSTYFGELVLTPQNLEEQFLTAVQPIRRRWLESVHQPVDAERVVRQMLGEPGAWDQMNEIGKDLVEVGEVITNVLQNSDQGLLDSMDPFITACNAFAETLLDFHTILAQGDLDFIRQKLVEQKTIIDRKVYFVLRKLRALNHPLALNATNALANMQIARDLLEDVGGCLEVGLVAVLADAGGGKTQMAAQLTAPQGDRPAGILLHGYNLHKGQTLDDLVKRFSVNGNPINSVEKLLVALDAAGKRAACRLPIVIDGLNEAENPKDWKSALASLGVTVKKYPNVLVICTLRTGEHRRDDEYFHPKDRVNARESFAVLALPEGVRKLESEGFGADVDGAIEKYFEHYKINAGDAEIPSDFLQHPLTLRIFCEVTNPERNAEIKIEYFPASLSSLFEKYIANACERISHMANLSYSYTADDVKTVIYKLGLELWKARTREIDEENFRNLISDDVRQWDSSIINLLAQEGIVFRNPGKEQGENLIKPVYDALGGYMVSSALLSKYHNDVSFEWLQESEAMDLFAGDSSHELAYNIFVSLVVLTPRRLHGRQLWKVAPDLFRNSALLYTTRLEANYLDKETLEGLLDLLNNNPKARSHLFLRLKETKGAVNHLLNAEFLDRALRKMSVSARDLSWTEWVRKSRSERFNELLVMESRWKENLSLRTPSDRLRIKWVMWHLTSTDRELRDIATRALYWYGRGDPAGLFEESEQSLEVNDPYVPERMLAASYGIAMVHHVNISDKDFIGKILSEYARNLYEMIFEVQAPYSTTHLLMREYAQRTIEIASIRNSNLFSDQEMKRAKPPFASGEMRDWSESHVSDEFYSSAESPFRMDFENYTIGRLVPDRGNYDYKHEGYRKVRAQLLWRVEQLGWTNEEFGKVDGSITNARSYHRTGSDAKKTERYGKKYSWIAYFEMSGLLHDTGVLDDWEGRTSAVDIDPSFPEFTATKNLINADFLGEPKLGIKDWIKNGPFPDVSSYLCLEELQSNQGPWVALDGYFAQEDKVRSRSIFCFIRSFLIANKDAAFFTDRLSCQDLEMRPLPQKPSVIYTFAGEIPWCKTFPENGKSKLTFVVKEDAIKRPKSKPDKGLLNVVFGKEYVEVGEMHRESVAFDTLIPVCNFGWEGHQTVASDAGDAITLAKEIALDLELIGHPQTFDTFTVDGKRATCNISDQSNEFRNNQSMFFIKQDLLKTYLEKNDLALVWVVWGERGYSADLISRAIRSSEKLYGVFGYIRCY